MNETYEPEKRENIESINLEELNFEQLKKVFEESSELAKTTFMREENGFRNVNGDGVSIEKKENIYKVIGASVPKFNHFMALEHSAIFHEGSSDKEEVMQALKEKLEEFEFRIIE